MGVPTAMSAQVLGSRCARSQFFGSQQPTCKALLNRRERLQPAQANTDFRAASVSLPASHMAASKAALHQLQQSTSVSGSFDGNINRETSALASLRTPCLCDIGSVSSFSNTSLLAYII